MIGDLVNLISRDPEAIPSFKSHSKFSNRSDKLIEDSKSSDSG